MDRRKKAHSIAWADGETVSAPVDLSSGCFGTILAPAALNGKTVQVRSTESAYNSSTYNLLTTAKTLATGKNAFTTDEIREIGAAGEVVFVLNSAVSGSATVARLLWSS